MNQKENIKLISIFIAFIFVNFALLYIIKTILYKNGQVNIVNSKLIDWGIGWKNTQSFYSGSELGFKFKNSRKISFEFTTTSKADQGTEILIDNDTYFITSPNLNNQQLSINIKEKGPHTVRVRYFCTFFYHPCNITLASIYLDSHSELMPYKSNKKVLSILGDSISTIYGKENYSYILADSLGYELHNASILGSTVSEIKNFDSSSKRYEKDLKPFRVDATIIFLGTNDVKNNVPLNVFKNDYSIMVASVKEWNSQNKIFLTGILPRGDIDDQTINSYNALIKEISQKYNVYYIDTSYFLNKRDLSDNIHPSTEAQKKLSEKFLEAISTRIN